MVVWFGFDYRVQRRGFKRHSLAHSVPARKLRHEPLVVGSLVVQWARASAHAVPDIHWGNSHKFFVSSRPLIRIDGWDSWAGESVKKINQHSDKMPLFREWPVSLALSISYGPALRTVFR